MSMPGFIIVSLMACWINFLSAMTNDKRIFGSVTDPGTYFDFFHMTPDGKVMVHTEFDLMLTLEQFNDLRGDDDGSRKRRKALKNTARHWKNCYVYYEIHESLKDPESTNVIKEALGEWSKYTCLIPVETSTQPRRIVFRDGQGCNSWVGMQDKPQDINLAKGCRTKGIVMHEIGHAIGFLHEQSRPDRDDYIKVNWKVVPESFYHNFEKYTDLIDTYGVPYDYLSIMHYGSGVINNSLITLDKNYQDKIGQRDGLSFKDIKLANLMYDCARFMGCDETDCPEEGFQFYENYKGKGSCKCWCDSGNVNDPLVLCSDPNRPRIPAPNPVPLPTDGPEPEPDVECKDLRPDCGKTDMKKQCGDENTMMMMKNLCPKTCGFCYKGKGMCMDIEKSCKMAKSQCRGRTKSTWKQLCPATCGHCGGIRLNSCDIYREFMGSDVAAPDGNNAGVTSSLTGPTLVIRVLVALVICFWCVKLTA